MKEIMYHEAFPGPHHILLHYRLPASISLTSIFITLKFFSSRTTTTPPTMRAFTTLVLGAVLLASQNGAEAFSPSARTKVLNDLKEMRMSGAGGAAAPDYYVEGESSCRSGLLMSAPLGTVGVFNIAPTRVSRGKPPLQLGNCFIVNTLEFPFVKNNALSQSLPPHTHNLHTHHPLCPSQSLTSSFPRNRTHRIRSEHRPASRSSLAPAPQPNRIHRHAPGAGGY